VLALTEAMCCAILLAHDHDQKWWLLDALLEQYGCCVFSSFDSSKLNMDFPSIRLASSSNIVHVVLVV
jgi:hypothetical protein